MGSLLPSIPHDPAPDSTVALLAEGYRFMANRRQRFASDTFATRLMLREAVCTMGAEAAELFYGDGRFTRTGAMPPTTVRLLQDKGSVQLLDGAEHHHRKQMFMSFMTPPSLQRLTDALVERWQQRLEAWERRDEVVLHDEMQEILFLAAADWVGIPVSERSAQRRTGEIAAMLEGAGSVGPRVIWGLLRRTLHERWARRVIERIRAGTPNVSEGSPAHAIAWHRDLAGELLPVDVAAVELINLLRPTVAVATYITFAALALHQYPEYHERIQAGDDAATESFVQEVRRFYPFFPFIGGRALADLDWQGHHMPQGTWVILDIYGTNHDARIWEEPDRFRPERFEGRDIGAFDFIPQGGGAFDTGHRCPGEWATIGLLQAAVRRLTRAMTYDVPPQDLSIDLSRMPALPASRFVISNVRRR